MVDHEFYHHLDETGLTLVSEGVSTSGVPLRFTVTWAHEELVNQNLAKAMSKAEELIRTHDERIASERGESIYAGSSAEEAQTTMKRVRLPFGRELAVYRFRNHEYDEGALLVGALKLTVPLRLTGGPRWSQLRLKRASKSDVLFGFGGAHRGFFVGLKHSR